MYQKSKDTFCQNHEIGGYNIYQGYIACFVDIAQYHDPMLKSLYTRFTSLYQNCFSNIDFYLKKAVPTKMECSINVVSN